MKNSNVTSEQFISSFSTGKCYSVHQILTNTGMNKEIAWVEFNHIPYPSLIEKDLTRPAISFTKA